MATFRTPQPVASKGVRRNEASRNSHIEKAYADFQPKAELFCSKCLAKSLIKQAHGFCKVCLDFLCKNCVDKHESTLLTLNHGIMVGEDMLERYHNAMKANKRTGKIVSRSQLEMVADGRASFQYFEDDTKESPQQEADDDTLEPKLIKEPKVRVSSDTKKCFICACTVFADGRAVLADANNKALKLFNKNFNLLHVFHLKKEPWDVCRAIDYDNDLYVTESKINGVHQFKISKDKVKYVLTVKADGECFGLADWKGGVAVSVKKDRKFSIKLLDQFGNTYRHIQDGFEGKLKIVLPWYLATTKKGQYLLISDSGTGTVSCLDVDGGVKFVYKDKKDLKDPRNIVADRDRNIFVVDYETDTVHQMTDKGEELGVVMCAEDGLENPCGMACHKELLYIQAKMDSNFMKVYDMV